MTISIGESNTVVSAYTTYTHLQQYCSHPSICLSSLSGTPPSSRKFEKKKFLDSLKKISYRSELTTCADPFDHFL